MCTTMLLSIGIVAVFETLGFMWRSRSTSSDETPVAVAGRSATVICAAGTSILPLSVTRSDEAASETSGETVTLAYGGTVMRMVAA